MIKVGRVSKVSKGNNNNAVPCTKGAGISGNKFKKSKKDWRSVDLQKFNPIIQTRGMKKLANDVKRKRKNKEIELDLQNEIQKLNEIDNLTSSEIADGDKAFEDNGVELSINGSDLEDDFPETSVDGLNNEEEIGMVSLSEEEEIEFSSTHKPTVSSKVVKVNQKMVNERSDKFSKFSHLQ